MAQSAADWWSKNFGYVPAGVGQQTSTPTAATTIKPTAVQTTTTATKPASSQSTSSNASKSTGSSSQIATTPGKINTTGLTGYALQYALARNAGADDATAHQVATIATGGSGVTKGYINTLPGGAAAQPNVSYAQSGQAYSPYMSTPSYAASQVIGQYTGTPVISPAKTPEEMLANLALLGQLQSEQGLQNLAQAAIAQNIPLPTAPDVSIQYPEINAMTYEEALRQAAALLDPQTALSKANILATYAKQREQLPQILNARGQLYGGLRAGGESKITQEQAKALEDLALQAEAKKGEMATSIQQKDYEKAQAEADRLYQEQVDKLRALQENYNRQLTAALQERSNAQNMLLALMEAARQEEAGRLAQQQWEQEQAAKLKQWEAEQALKKEEIYLPYQYPTANATIAYEYGLTPYQQAQLNLEQQRINKIGTSSGGSSAATTKAAQQAAAEAYMQANMSKFKRPIDFLAQLRRNYEAGKISKNTYDFISSYINKAYANALEEPFETWKPKTTTSKTGISDSDILKYLQ